MMRAIQIRASQMCEMVFSEGVFILGLGVVAVAVVGFGLGGGLGEQF